MRRLRARFARTTARVNAYLEADTVRALRLLALGLCMHVGTITAQQVTGPWPLWAYALAVPVWMAGALGWGWIVGLFWARYRHRRRMSAIDAWLAEMAYLREAAETRKAPPGPAA